MDQRARNYIMQSADLISKTFHIVSPIQDISAVVTQLDGKIIETDDYSLESSIERQEGTHPSFIIRISKNQSPTRKKFAIAHEIGHLFLHMGYMSNESIWKSEHLPKDVETQAEQDFQAHEFAANFLMPTKSYLNFVAQNTNHNTIDAYLIAEYFGVSESAATIRGKLIGALKWT